MEYDNTAPPDTKRYSFRHFEAARFYVYDGKYDEEYMIDLEDKDFDNGKCGCKEFRFQVEIKERRTFCGHLDFLYKSLRLIGATIGQAPKRLRPPSFKSS
jgi:hypothetical protein